MDFDIIDLDDEQIDDIEKRLSEYDLKHIKYKISGSVNIGVIIDGELIAGASGCMTAYKIFYIQTVYVNENQRGKGVGRKLIECLEKKAASFGANMIRLDTFDWQGADFYKKLGYEQVGRYENKTDGFSECFFLKSLKLPS